MLNRQRARYVIRDTVSGFYVAIDSCRHMFTLSKKLISFQVKIMLVELLLMNFVMTQLVIELNLLEIGCD